jgi:hypothetical protein
MTLTIVSGYWNVKGKHSFRTFEHWFKNTLSINCPYIFFGDSQSIDIVKKIRCDLPTTYIEFNISEFETFKYKNNLIHHDIHCPSKEVLLIWNEKIFLIQKAKIMNPYNSSFFMWVDAGICIYREQPPPTISFPNIKKLNFLPTNKFIFTSSDYPYFEKERVHDNNYYHYISGNFMLHSDFIDTFTYIYRKYVDRYLSQYNWVNSEQKILTHIYNENPDLFFKIADGYGAILPALY